VVIDYKSASKRSVELFRLVAGISLQLPLYALVARELAGMRPLAALYIALGVRPETLDYEGQAVSAGSDEFFQKFKPRGLIDALGAWMLDEGLPTEGGGKSAWYRMVFNKDGGPRKGSDVLRHEDFEELLRFTREKIAKLGDELASGEIAPLPYRCGGETPCEYCDFGSLCPFDGVRGRYREVRKRSNGEAIEHMRNGNGKNRK
jgi:ATP-dependent helicase/nuclease subunit B